MADSTLSNLTSLTLPSQATDLLLVGRGTARPNKVAMSDALNSAALAATTGAYGVVQLAASGGTTAGTVVQATDARLSDTRNPPDGSKGDIVVSGSGSTWTIKTNPTLSGTVSAGSINASGRVTATGTTAFPYEGQLIASNSSPSGTNSAVSQAILQAQPGYTTFVGTTGDGTTASYRTGGLGNVVVASQSYLIGDGASGMLLHSINGPTIFATQNTGSEKMRLASNGNLLIGTTTDNALGRLQVSGAITATETGGTGLFGFFGGSSLVVGTLGAASMVLRTNNTAALTFDNSQNASFTGNVQVPADKGLYLKQGNVFKFTSDGTTAGTSRADMYADSGGAFFIRTGGATQALTINSSQFATFSKDVQLQGSSGPQVLQTLAARGPKQGVLTNGTFGVNVGALVSPFGTADFTLAFIVRRDTNAVQQYLVGNDIGQCLYVGFRTNGDVFSGQAGGTPNADLSLATPLGRPFHLVLVRSAGTITAYVNALSSATVSDSKNYTGAANTLFAADSAGSAALDGLGIVQGFYNRALSATEVRELYEMGTPNQSERAISGSIAPSNTGLTTSTAAQNFQYDTFSGSTNGFTAVETGGQACEANFVSGTTFLGRAMKGARYLIQFTATLTSGAVPTVRLSTQGVSGVSSAIVNVSAGANAITLQTTEPFTAETGTGAGRITFASSANTSYAISGLTVTRLGAILAPDADQLGSGLTWYDTSGNGNNITLPANGVAWNVPFNGRMQFGDGTAAAPSLSFTNDSNTGFYKVAAAADVLYFAANGGGSLRFTTNGSIYSGVNNSYLQLNPSGDIYASVDGTTNGSLVLEPRGTGNVVIRNLSGIGNRTRLEIAQTGLRVYHIENTATTGDLAFGSGGGEFFRLFGGAVGTVLFGTPTNSGNGRLQLADHTAATGGIGMGTDWSFFRLNTSILRFETASVSPGLSLRHSTSGTELTLTASTASGNGIVNTVSCNNLVLGVNGGTALTLDNAQNATFAGKIIDPGITGTILEDIFTITDAAAFEVDPGNGSIQLITLGASRTPKATNFAAGESITLMVNDGTAYTLTWTDATWGTGGVAWVGGSAPTLATTGYTVIQFWKVGTQVYGARVGDVA